jgi:hypothetical protein
MRPYSALAAQLRQASYRGEGTILSEDTISGNFRVTFPKARILDTAFPELNWPGPTGEGQCLLVWPLIEGRPKAIPTFYEEFLSDVLHGRLEALHIDGTASAPMLFPAEGEFSLGYRLYDGPNGDCR